MHSYEYPRPMVSVDAIIINKVANEFLILLIKRLNNPFKDCWALPGGFVDENESLENAAKRELKEETSLENLDLKQFATYGNPGRDPRGHSVSIIYYAVISNGSLRPKAGDDAKEVEWFAINKLPELAFDHSLIIKEFIESNNIV